MYHSGDTTPGGKTSNLQEVVLCLRNTKICAHKAMYSWNLLFGFDYCVRQPYG